MAPRLGRSAWWSFSRPGLQRWWLLLVVVVAGLLLLQCLAFLPASSSDSSSFARASLLGQSNQHRHLSTSRTTTFSFERSPRLSLTSLVNMDPQTISDATYASWIYYDLARMNSSPDARLYLLSRLFRVYKLLYMSNNPLRMMIEKALFPFERNPNTTSGLVNLRDSFQGRGIVTTISSNQMLLLFPLLKTLRYKLNCTLPIQVLFLGTKDLSPAEQASLASWIPGLTLIDMQPLLSDQALRISGYNLKLLAIMFSTYEQVLFLDADVVMLSNPAEYFDFAEFQESGTLFFHDIKTHRKPSYFAEDWRFWLYSFMPDMTLNSTSDDPGFINGKSNMLIESGVVLFDKRRRFPSLLAQTSLTLPGILDLFTGRFLGDKELFWFAAEMMHEPISIFPGLASFIGPINPEYPTSSLPCDYHVVHLSRDQTFPLWFNNGIYQNKEATVKIAHNFSHFGRHVDGEKRPSLDIMCWTLIDEKALPSIVFIKTHDPPVSRPVPARLASIIDFHWNWASQVAKDHAKLSIATSLRSRSHSMSDYRTRSNATLHKHKEDDTLWQDSIVRTKREILAMQRAIADDFMNNKEEPGIDT